LARKRNLTPISASSNHDSRARNFSIILRLLFFALDHQGRLLFLAEISIESLIPITRQKTASVKLAAFFTLTTRSLVPFSFAVSFARVIQIFAEWKTIGLSDLRQCAIKKPVFGMTGLNTGGVSMNIEGVISIIPPTNRCCEF
jgi:hypothetical protein